MSWKFPDPLKRDSEDGTFPMVTPGEIIMNRVSQTTASNFGTWINMERQARKLQGGSCWTFRMGT